MLLLLINGLEGTEPASSPDQKLTNATLIAKGKTYVQVTCNVCHSTMIIEAAHKTEAKWRKTLSKMETQGMAKIPATLEPSILAYLVAEQGPAAKQEKKAPLPWADKSTTNPLW